MRYAEELNEEKKIVITRVSGLLTVNDFAPIAVQARVRAKEFGYSVLFDFTDSQNNISIIQIYHWVVDNYDKVDPTLKRIPTAHIASRKDWDFFEFVQNTWGNRGMPIRLFEDEAKAIAWLGGEVHRFNFWRFYLNR